MAGQPQSEAETGSATADNQHIVLVTGCHKVSVLAPVECGIFDVAQRLSFD
jgi:hypothetical protein